MEKHGSDSMVDWRHIWWQQNSRFCVQWQTNISVTASRWVGVEKWSSYHKTIFVNTATAQCSHLLRIQYKQHSLVLLIGSRCAAAVWYDDRVHR